MKNSINLLGAHFHGIIELPRYVSYRYAAIGRVSSSASLLVCLFTIIKITHIFNILQFFTAVKNNIFQMKNCDIFLIFARNRDFGYTSTHNLCFRAKIRK